MNPLYVIGTNYKRAGFVDLSGWTLPVAFRDMAMQALKARFQVHEAMYLSTCNRSELIIWAEQGFSPRRVTRVWREWAARGGQELSEKADLEVRHGQEALNYLFRVAASLDSLVVGETEIMRQLREAFQKSQARGSAGFHLRTVLERALKTGREIRQQTMLSSLSSSVVSVAMREIRRRLQDQKVEHALIVGAGETGRTVSRSLRKTLGVKRISIVNRTLDKAEELAREVQGQAYGLKDFKRLVREADVLVSAISLAKPIVRTKNPGLHKRKKPILLVDLAIPPNIEAACGDLPMVSRIGIGELEAIAAAQRPMLEQEIERAGTMVERGLEKLQADFKMAAQGRVLCQARSRMEALGEEEIEAVLLEQLADLDSSRKEQLRKRLKKMVKRLTHTATNEFKEHIRASCSRSAEKDAAKNIRVLPSPQ